MEMDYRTGMYSRADEGSMEALKAAQEAGNLAKNQSLLDELFMTMLSCLGVGVQ